MFCFVSVNINQILLSGSKISYSKNVNSHKSMYYCLWLSMESVRLFSPSSISDFVFSQPEAKMPLFIITCLFSVCSRAVQLTMRCSGISDFFSRWSGIPFPFSSFLNRKEYKALPKTLLSQQEWQRCLLGS